MRQRWRRRAAATGAAGLLLLIGWLAADPRAQQAAPGAAVSAAGAGEVAGAAAASAVGAGAGAAARAAYYRTQLRLQEDLAALRRFRPSYPFWRHIYTIPDGSIIYGSAADGRLLATFPRQGDWARAGEWTDPALAGILEGRDLPRRLRDRRRALEELLAAAAGPVVQNATRGRFLSRHAERHADFLRDWGAIYERFGVPAEIGLAQAIVESGLNGRARSRARALGFCQWLPRNWNRLQRLSPYVIEGYNQTTQAPFCAAYLTILTTMYGSFIPALSEHHAGGVNVGRTLVNGARLGGQTTRERYLLGSDFARALRGISVRRYRALYRTYGNRSALYAEMVFGNTHNVRQLLHETPQSDIHAMRVPRTTPLAAVVEHSGLSRDEVQRYNPALVRRVPADAAVYLPAPVAELGEDVTFWRRPPSAEYAAALADFVSLDAPVETWHDPSFEEPLQQFRERFAATGTEEGTVMATMLAFVIGDLIRGRRGAILDEFRTSDRVQELFERGLQALRERE